MKGIDISSHQGQFNWDKAKENAIEFAMLRAGYGNNNIDTQFLRNASECTRLKIPFGVYWFSYGYTVSMARQEALYCLAVIKNYKLEFPVCYDLEYDTIANAKKNGVEINKELATQMVMAFCDTIRTAGFYPMNYTNQDYLNSYFDLSKIKNYDIWYAHYADAAGKNDISIWQYTESGTLTGINDKIDLNISYKDYPVIIKLAGLNDWPKPQISVWIKKDNRWWYRHSDGSYTKDDWELINHHWYLFDAEGYMLTGFTAKNGEYYYLCENTALVEGACMVTNERGSLKIWEVNQ